MNKVEVHFQALMHAQPDVEVMPNEDALHFSYLLLNCVFSAVTNSPYICLSVDAFEWSSEPFEEIHMLLHIVAPSRHKWERDVLVL